MRIRTALGINVLVVLCAAGPADPDALLIERASAAIRHNHLAPSACLSYRVDRDADEIVHVSRQHGGSCGGDPEVDEHLFDVHIDPKTGAMTTNARDPEGLEETPLAP